ncbi:MAG TPA: DUF4168 domain-containing protein [Salinimicrobium sp.]|nr:DUF4168 domain-containing protein [Salinimicrobium sp.]
MNFTRMKIAGVLLFLIFSTTVKGAQTGQEAISDEEISKFAITFQKMRVMNQKMQKEMTGVISEKNMEIARFNKIHKANLDPSVDVEITEEEQEKYEKIVSQLDEMQLSYRKKMEETITASGLTPQRYQQISKRLQTDKELQERLKAELQG